MLSLCLTCFKGPQKLMLKVCEMQMVLWYMKSGDSAGVIL